jgi:hypothetical protein
MYPCNKPGWDVETPPYKMGEVTPEALERLAGIGKNYTERYMHQCWIENDETGFTGWRWDRFSVPLIIVSAANRYKDIIVMGPRHYSNLMHTAIEALGGINLLMEYSNANSEESEYEQGFVDQYNTFHTREEAFILATAAGQIRYPENCHNGRLYSEGIC